MAGTALVCLEVNEPVPWYLIRLIQHHIKTDKPLIIEAAYQGMLARLMGHRIEKNFVLYIPVVFGRQGNREGASVVPQAAARGNALIEPNIKMRPDINSKRI
ncbi:MAG: hypothetical protein NTAFB05_21640 [Nitrobacter sp.]